MKTLLFKNKSWKSWKCFDTGVNECLLFLMLSNSCLKQFFQATHTKVEIRNFTFKYFLKWCTLWKDVYISSLLSCIGFITFKMLLLKAVVKLAQKLMGNLFCLYSALPPIDNLCQGLSNVLCSPLITPHKALHIP